MVNCDGGNKLHNNAIVILAITTVCRATLGRINAKNVIKLGLCQSMDTC